MLYHDIDIMNSKSRTGAWSSNGMRWQRSDIHRTGYTTRLSRAPSTVIAHDEHLYRQIKIRRRSGDVPYLSAGIDVPEIDVLKVNLGNRRQCTGI